MVSDCDGLTVSLYSSIPLICRIPRSTTIYLRIAQASHYTVGKIHRFTRPRASCILLSQPRTAIRCLIRPHQATVLKYGRYPNFMMSLICSSSKALTIFILSRSLSVLRSARFFMSAISAVLPPRHFFGYMYPGALSSWSPLLIDDGCVRSVPLAVPLLHSAF